MMKQEHGVIHEIVICYTRKFHKSFCLVLLLNFLAWTKIWPSHADMSQAHRLLPDLTALYSLQLEFLNALKVHLGLTLLENAGFQQPEMAAWVCVRSQNGTGWHKVLSGVTNTFCVGEVTPENQSQQGVFFSSVFSLYHWELDTGRAVWQRLAEQGVCEWSDRCVCKPPARVEEPSCVSPVCVCHFFVFHVRICLVSYVSLSLHLKHVV